MATAPTGPYRVRRPFDANGQRVLPGDIVDVTDWKNGYQLVDRGYIVVIPADELISETVAVDIAVEDVDGDCPKCGASGDDPCVSRTGRVTGRHATRA